MLRDPEMRINILSCKGTDGVPSLGKKIRKKRDSTKSLGLYVGHLRIFFQSFLPDHLPNRRAILGRDISFTKHSWDDHSPLTIYLTHLLYGVVRKSKYTQGDASSLGASLSCHNIFFNSYFKKCSLYLHLISHTGFTEQR